MQICKYNIFIMKKSVFCKVFCAFFLFSAIFFSANAENFRVRKVLPIQISENGGTSKVVSGISDAVFITLPEDRTFISGIELSFKIPEEIALWRDSVAYVFYGSVSPSPSGKVQNYSGNKIFFNTIPAKLSLTLDVPLASDFPIKKNPYSVRVSQSEEFQKGIFIRFMQVMKGVPETLEAAEIEISAKAVLRDKGILNLSVTPPQSDEKKYTVYIDEKPAEISKKIMLDTGEHHLSVSSESYRNEVRTFRIEQGKTTEVELALRGNEPTLRILNPVSAVVLLDGNPVENTKNPLLVEPGEHTVKFTLGGYEVVKTVSVEKGHSYTVSLDVGASVSEEE